MNMGSSLIKTCLGIACLGAFAWAQTQMDTVKIRKMKVTYYDFHEDGSNPEFEPKVTNLLSDTNLVLDTLDKDRKPIKNPAKGPTCRVNNIYKWYRAWDKNDPVPTYMYSDTIISYTYDSVTFDVTYDTVIYKDDTLKGDTIFKNVVINDSITFRYLPDTAISMHYDDTLGYVRDTIALAPLWKRTSKLFFPIDRRGFHTDTSDTSHNHSFTMELHTSIVYKGGEFIKLGSDDDSWTFINNHLAIDRGGYRPVKDSTVWLDSLSTRLGLEKGKTYSFDLFFADRKVKDAVLNIVTNVEFADGKEGIELVPHIAVLPSGWKAHQKKLIGLFGNAVIPDGEKVLRLAVYNCQGKQMSSTIVSLNSLTKKVPEIAGARKLSSGTYIVKLQTMSGRNISSSAGKIVIP